MMNLILVVSKDPEIGRSVTSAVDSGWSRVWTCYNPKDAISMIGQQEPAMIVLDGRTELFPALDLSKKIKKNLKMDYISFLLFTPGVLESDELAEAGIDETLPWPSAVPVISHKIRLLVEKYESKKIRKNHSIEVDESDAKDFLKSNTQYDEQKTADPFHLNRKSIFFTDSVTPAVPAAPEEPKAWGKQNSIELPEDFFSDTEGLSLEKTHHSEESLTDLHNFSMNTTGRTAKPDVSQQAYENLSTAFDQLTPEHLDELAAKLLDQKLTKAAKENIRKLIAKSVREELEKMIPEIIESLKKRMD